MHLVQHLKAGGHQVLGSLQKKRELLPEERYCNILEYPEIVRALECAQPDYVINLAGISFVSHPTPADFYEVNILGAENILKACQQVVPQVKKIIMVSSSVVYGNQRQSCSLYEETLCPNPVNHYGVSKYGMEQIAKNYMEALPIIIARPFNYTGVGQAEHFLVPKIVGAYAKKQDKLELGNLQVQRELNDISYVCEVYQRLLFCPQASEIVNISSERAICLLNIIEMMDKFVEYSMPIAVNPLLVRKSEIPILVGSAAKLNRMIGEVPQCEFKQTLWQMYQAMLNNAAMKCVAKSLNS